MCCRRDPVRNPWFCDRVEPLIQWRDKVIDPVFESRTDHEIMAMFAKKFGLADEFFKNIKMDDR